MSQGGSQPLLYRLYKLSLASGLALSLPPIVLAGWFVWKGIAAYALQARAGAAPPFDLQLLHLLVHDELEREVRQLTVGERPAQGGLPTYSLTMRRKDLGSLHHQLAQGVRVSDVSVYQKRPHPLNVHVEADGRTEPGTIEFWGYAHEPWNWLPPQKSMRVRLKKGHLLGGVREFLLLNDPGPLGVEEQVVLDLAREEGLLGPRVRPVWVRLNGRDLGVYTYAMEPNEGMLRTGRRIPSSIYAGALTAAEPAAGVGPLFADRSRWTKVARRSASVEKRPSYEDLDRLLAKLRASHRELLDFARHELDLEKFAVFDALDVVFGTDHHGFVENHRLYFDRYRGRIEPIAWSFGGFGHFEGFEQVENPLQLRLKMLPGYLALRDRAVYRLLTGRASPAELRRRIEDAAARLAPALRADPCWDAYELLPPISRAYRTLVRPMSEERWALLLRASLRELERRNHELRAALEQRSLAQRWVRLSPTLGALELTVAGTTSVAIEQMALEGTCGGFRVHADGDLDGTLGERDPKVAESRLGSSSGLHAYRELLAGVRLDARRDPGANEGTVHVARSPRTYRYFVQTDGCPVLGGALTVRDLVTGASHLVPLDLARVPVSGEPAPVARPDDVPALAPGEESPHPWLFVPDPPPEVVHLGPGTIVLDGSREYLPQQTVRIAPGTRIEMPDSAALVFLGPVFAEGTAASPIEVVRADPHKPFGGVALLGPATADSRLSHLRVRGGTSPRYRLVTFTGMVNIHDTSNIVCAHCTFAQNTVSDDTLHAGYVAGLVLDDLTITESPVDAVDFDFVDGVLLRASLSHTGGECLDLMASNVEVADSTLIACGDKGISNGEESQLGVRRTLIADSAVALAVKNASRAILVDTLIYRAKTAIRSKWREDRFAGPSLVKGERLFAEQAGILEELNGKPTRLAVATAGMPASGELDVLLREVLGLSSWRALPDFLADAEGAR